MALDISAFMRNGEQLAIQFHSKELPGLLSKELVVPEEAVALVQEGRDDKCLKAGETATGSFHAVLVKVSSQVFHFQLHNLKSQDDLALSAQVSLELQPRAVELDLVQLRSSLLKERGALFADDIHEHFMPAVKAALMFFAAKEEAQTLIKTDMRNAVYQHLRQDLQKALFETGFDLKDVRHPTFESEAFDKLSEEKLKERAREEALVNEKRLEMLRKELDKEILLKDIEARDEVDRKRKEARLEQYESMKKRMGEDDLKALVMMLDDDNKRATLIKELIEKDMSPEQRRSLKLSEMESKLEERLREMQAKMAALTGEVLESKQDDPKTRRILCVVGKRVLAFDPCTNLHPEVPKEVYDTGRGNLGYLRSVRYQSLRGKDTLLIGAQRGIYRIVDNDQSEYLFHVEPKGKGGANSAAFVDGRLFASHSELGIVAWNDGRPKEGEHAYSDSTDGQSSTRGVMIGDDGRLYFSSGTKIHAVSLTDNKVVAYNGSRDSITAFYVSRKRLIAGTKTGQILEWDLDDPNSPRENTIKKKNPIYMLRTTRIGGVEHLIIGSKDFTVTVAAPKKDLYREYHAREEVRWVDGAGDVICGVSRSGYKLFVWDVNKLSEPKLVIRVSDKIQDLTMIKDDPQT